MLSQDKSAFLSDGIIGKHLYFFSVLLLKDKQRNKQKTGKNYLCGTQIRRLRMDLSSMR